MLAGIIRERTSTMGAATGGDGKSMAHVEATETDSATLPSSVRVAVVDDHESVRLGLKAAFLDAGYNFVLAAATVDEFVAELGGREVDVVVLDLSLGDGSTVTDNVKRVQATGSAVLVHSIADLSRAFARRSPRVRLASFPSRRQRARYSRLPQR